MLYPLSYERFCTAQKAYRIVGGSRQPGFAAPHFPHATYGLEGESHQKPTSRGEKEGLGASKTGAVSSPDLVVELLERIGLPYEIIACDPALADTAAFCDAYGYSPDESANAILVVGKSTPTVYALCVVLASTRLDVNGVVRRRLGTKKASFANADQTIAMTGMAIGGVTPFGLPRDLSIWVDRRVAECQRIIVGGGSRDRKVLCPPSTLLALVTAEIVDDLAR